MGTIHRIPVLTSRSSFESCTSSKTIHFADTQSAAAQNELKLHKLEEAVVVTSYSPPEIEELRKLFDSRSKNHTVDALGQFLDELQTFLEKYSVYLSDSVLKDLKQFLKELKLDFPEFVLFVWHIQDPSCPGDIDSAQKFAMSRLNHPAPIPQVEEPSTQPSSESLPGRECKPPV